MSAMKLSFYSLAILIYSFVCSCGASKSLFLPVRKSDAITGSVFFKEVATVSWEKRGNYGKRGGLVG